jgi:hypothetical protein
MYAQRDPNPQSPDPTADVRLRVRISLQVPYPPFYRTVLSWMAVFELDMFAFVPFGCAVNLSFCAGDHPTRDLPLSLLRVHLSLLRVHRSARVRTAQTTFLSFGRRCHSS